MADGRVAQTLDVIGRRRGKSALDDDAVAFAGFAVAGNAIDFKALLAAFEAFRA